MEDNKAFLECLPKEIFYNLACYIDLQELSALLLTSKHINGLIQSDLALQKIACDATPKRARHKILGRPIRLIYYDHLESLAIKYNDANIMKYALENLSAEHIISRLRPKSSYIQVKKQKLDLLSRIISCDADKVLDFLLEECQKITVEPEVKWAIFTNQKIIAPPYVSIGVKMKYDGKEVELTPAQEEMAVYFARLLGTPHATNLQFIKNFFNDWTKVLNPKGSNKPHIIQKFELCDFAPLLHQPKEREKIKLKPVRNNAAIENLFNFLIDECFGEVTRPEKCTYPKIIAVVMKFINENRKFLIDSLLKRIAIESKTGLMLQTMLKYAKFFKLPIDLNEPIEIKATLPEPIEFEATPLEAAAFYGFKNVFHMFREYKAVLDLKKPYLPLLFIKNRSDKNFYNYLSKLGADLNAPLPKGFAPNKITILAYAAEKLSFNDVELLLFQGAKLSKEETDQFLRENNSAPYKQQIATAQLEKYDPKTRKAKIIFDQNNAISFKSEKSLSSLILMADGHFEYNNGSTRRIGSWKQDSGKLKLTSDAEKRHFHCLGSYGSGEVTLSAPLMTLEFMLYRNFANELSVALLGLDGSFDINIALHQV